MKWLRTVAGLSWRNPVALKELRIGLRERRILILQVLYLFLLLGLSLLMLPDFFNHRNSEQLAESGKNFFQVLFWVQLLLLIFTTPALTCGSLSGERERHSLDMVLASRLSSGELVAGKLGFAAYCLLLLLFSALPLASICFFLGGISLTEALSSYLELFLFGMLAASIGLFSSARESRSNYSTAQTYLLVLVLSFGLPIYGALRYEGGRNTIPVGPAWWTFQQVWELGIFQFFLGAAAYVITFLFFKARHRLRPQARNLTGMAWIFVALYLFCLCWIALLMSVQTSNNDLQPLAFVVYLFHMATLGFFLNPAHLESVSEAEQFRASLVSRKLFWMIFSVLGCLSPSALLMVLGQDASGLTYGVLYTLFILLIYPLNVWLFQKALLPRWQYAWVYYLGLMLLQFLPALGSFAAEDSLWRLYFVSPLLTLMWAMTPDRATQGQEFTVWFSVAFQGTGALVLWLLYRWRQHRQKRG